MHKQLADINSKIFDPQRRKHGTASVLLYGSPGSGKTHVARQYIYNNRSKFQGGIFWINARGAQLERDLWSIAEKAVAGDSPELRIDSNGKGKDVTSTVRDWFSSREDWLIVLDGVAVDRKKDIEMLENVLPNKPNSSLIYTSRSNQFRVSLRLLNPRAVKIPSLTNDEGQELIFTELNIRRTPRGEKAAAEIVKRVGGMPLAIHAVCVRLANTGEPIEMYKPRSWAEDEMVKDPFRTILDGLRDEHLPAYNLMNILAFFGPHIPVELIRLGVRGLQSSGLSVKSSTGYSATPEINGSLSILRRNALIERNEDDDLSTPTNSSQSTLLDNEPTDVLRLHTVVQRLCRDRLEEGTDKEPPQLPEWIDIASKILKRSYETACKRMEEREGEYPPRVTDHQEYLVHAQEMREHSVTYGQKSRSMKIVRSNLDRILDDINSRLKELKPVSSQESVIRTRPVPSVFDRVSTTSSSSLASGDDMWTPDEQEDKRLPGQSKQGTDVEEPLQSSPADYRAPRSGSLLNVETEQNGSPGAQDMLRSISERTAKPYSAISDEVESDIEPRHNRTVSLPSLNRSNNLFPSPTRAYASIDPQNAEATFALHPDSVGNTPRYYGLFPRFGSSQSPKRPSNLGSFMTPPPNSGRYSADAIFPPPPTSPQRNQRMVRMPSGPSPATPAPPMLSIHDPPNPMAPTFRPVDYGQSRAAVYPYQTTGTMNPGLASMAGPGYIPNPDPYHVQQQGTTYQVFNPYVYEPTQPILAPQMQPLDRYRASVPSSFQPGLDSRLQPYAPNSLSPQMSTTMPADDFYRHERALSVPNMASPPSTASYVDPLRRVSAISSPMGWSGGYAQSTQIMSRETSMQSNSSGSGGSVIYSAPVPQYPPQYAQSAHMLPQASPPTNLSPSPPIHVVPGPSPLQSVQNVVDVPSPAAASQATIGIPNYQTSPPPSLVPSGYPSPAYPMETGAQSAPATTVIPSPVGVVYTPVPVAPQPVSGAYSSYIPSTAPGSHMSSSPPVAQSMSRTGSNPGPGIAVQGMEGLGIAEFGGPGGNSTLTGAVTFGENDPVNILEARRRSLANEAILISQQQQEEQQLRRQSQQRDGVFQPEPGRGESAGIDVTNGNGNKTGARPEWGTQSELLPQVSTTWNSPQMQPTTRPSVPTISGPAPYPDLNKIPADTDISQLQSMVEQVHDSEQHPTSPPHQRHHDTQQDAQYPLQQLSLPLQRRQTGHAHTQSQGAIEQQQRGRGNGTAAARLSRRLRRQSEPQYES